MNEIDPTWIKEAKISASERTLLENNIVTGCHVKQDVWRELNNDKSGFKLPWRTFDELFWLVKGELTILSGYSGHGKSAFVNQIALHLSLQNIKVFECSFELNSGKLWKRIYRQTTGIADPTFTHLSKILNFYNYKLFTLDLEGNIDIDKVLGYSEIIYDIAAPEVFIFDNLMMLNALVDKFEVQHAITQKLLRFAQKKNVHVILVAHSKKPYPKDGTLPQPNMYDVSGSSNIVNMASNHLSITTNNLKISAKHKMQEGIALSEKEKDSLQFGDCLVFRDKSRDVGKNFKKQLYFCEKFQRFEDYHGDICRCKPYALTGSLANENLDHVDDA